MEVTLQQMLDAREKRAAKQADLIRSFHLPLVCFSMNIPGPVKDSPLIRRGFEEGCKALDCLLPPSWVKHREIYTAHTGCEAFYVLRGDALEIKKITTAIEDTHGLGRLFDMDVLDTDFSKIDREKVGGNSRDCIVCGAKGRGCAARRLHSVEQLQQTTTRILTRHFAKENGTLIGTWAVQSLLDEVCTTPKPGLVDCQGCGSHRDMDIFTFMASAAALAPYFHQCVSIGQETREKSPEDTFFLLRQAGKMAEQAMFSATSGVNTHKGAIFTMGILCGAAGRLWRPEEMPKAEDIFPEVSAMTAKAMEEDFKKAEQDTSGQRIYHNAGIRGIRGEVSQGLPSVKSVGLPVYRACRQKGMSKNDAGVLTLLHLMTQVEDTNMISRGGLEAAQEAAASVRRLLSREPIPTRESLMELSGEFTRKNLSPGGCADLLAAVYFLAHLEP